MGINWNYYPSVQDKWAAISIANSPPDQLGGYMQLNMFNYCSRTG